MIRKLLGKGSLTRKVAAAVDALDSRAVDTLTYISRLEDALEQLDGFDEQLQAKIDNGQIADPEASGLSAISSDIRTSIKGLIANPRSAGPSESK